MYFMFDLFFDNTDNVLRLVLDSVFDYLKILRHLASMSMLILTSVSACSSQSRQNQ